jgi:hypothetical protein
MRDQSLAPASAGAYGNSLKGRSVFRTGFPGQGGFADLGCSAYFFLFLRSNSATHFAFFLDMGAE